MSATVYIDVLDGAYHFDESVEVQSNQEFEVIQRNHERSEIVHGI
jgi:hypothetical protein